MLEKLLEKLGLSEKESKVYLAILELGKDSVQNIAVKADIARPTTYVILEKLLNFGLVSTIDEGKKTFFMAENPKELEKLLEEQKRDIEERRKELDQNLSQLMAIYNASEHKPTVRYYEGIEGLLALERFSSSKQTKQQEKEILNIVSVEAIEKMFPKERTKALGERINQNIKARVIYTRSQGPFSEEENKRDLREGIHLPLDTLSKNVGITIFPNAIKIFVFNEQYPHGILIEDEDIANNFKKIFELAWKGAKGIKI